MNEHVTAARAERSFRLSYLSKYHPTLVMKAMSAAHFYAQEADVDDVESLSSKQKEELDAILDKAIDNAWKLIK